MIKKQLSSFNAIRKRSGQSWFLLFFSLALFIFLFRGFLFNEYGGFHYYYIEDIVPFLILLLSLFAIISSLLFFYLISLEKKRELEMKNPHNLLKESVSKYKDLNIFYFFMFFSFFVTIFLSWILSGGAGNSVLMYFSLIFVLFIIIFGSLVILMKSVLKTINIFNSSNIIVGNIKNTKQLIVFCMKSKAFGFLVVFMSFVLFLGAFLSDLLRRSTDEAMVGVYIMFFLLAVSIPVAVLTFIGMLIATKGIKKSLSAKSLFLLSAIVISVLTFYVFFRILWIDLYF